MMMCEGSHNINDAGADRSNGSDTIRLDDSNLYIVSSTRNREDVQVLKLRNRRRCCGGLYKGVILSLVLVVAAASAVLRSRKQAHEVDE